MKIVVYGPGKRVGVIRDRDNTVIDAARAHEQHVSDQAGNADAPGRPGPLVPSELPQFIAGGQATLDATRAAVNHLDKVDVADIVLPLSKVKLHAPCPPGARIACAGGNFADHAGAMFAKRNRKSFTSAMVDTSAADIRKLGIWRFWKIIADPVGHDGEVIYPDRTARFDYEGELGIILSKPAKDVHAGDYKDYVWGVTLVSDWSIRDYGEPAGPLKFAMVKNFDTSVSLGPCILVGHVNPADVTIETFVNGERRQSFNTKDMVFSFGEYLQFLSRDLTLQPGDVVTGGTAKGTAADSSALMSDGSSAPELFLKPGDVVEVTSPAIGTLRNRIVPKRS